MQERGGLSRRERLAVGERAGVAEAAGVLRVGEDAVHGLLARAEVLAGLLPGTVAALSAGEITGAAGTLVAGEVREYATLLATIGTDEGTVQALEDAVARTEADLVAGARAGRTTGWLRDRAVKVRERCHPRSFEQRRADAMAERCVRVGPMPDGMARLSAVLPAPVACRIIGRLSATARALRDGEAGDPDVTKRTVAQVRADVLADLLGGWDGSTLGGGLPPPVSRFGSPGRAAEGTPPPDTRPAPRTRPAHEWTVDERAGVGSGRLVDVDGSSGPPEANGGTGEPPPAVVVTIPAETVFAEGDGPGWLAGFGPVAAEDARRLAALAHSFCLAVSTNGAGQARGDPPGVGSGAPPAPVQPEAPWDLEPAPVVVPVWLTTGRQYRIPAALRRALSVRDGTCRFPGCRRSTVRCDLDHVVAWADGGSTVPGNLVHLCRKHHVLKHHSAWSVTATGGEGIEVSGNGISGVGVSGDEGTGTRAGTRTTPTPVPMASTLTWTSPAGNRYVTAADDPAPF